MPGVLVDDVMPFALDSASFYDSLQSSASSSPSVSSPQYFSPFIPSSLCDASATFGDLASSMDHHRQAAEYHRFLRGGASSSSDACAASAQDLLLEAAAMVAAAAAASSPPGSAGGDAHVAAALQKFLPSNSSDEAGWSAEDVYSCDEFRMFEFKVRRCMRGRSHDWTECPFAHPGEKARRRDPRRFHYSGTACPDFRKGSCKNGDSCELAHGVFECWLHPARYRTQPCKDGRNCKRRVCFFAHTPEQLRVLSNLSSPSGSSGSSNCSSSSSARSAASSAAGAVHLQQQQQHHLHQQQLKSSSCNRIMISSPTSTLMGIATSPPALSPPLSPSGSPPQSPMGGRYASRMATSFDQRRLSFGGGYSTSSPPSSPGAAAAVHHHHSAFSSPCASPKSSMSDLVSALHQLELSKQAVVAAGGTVAAPPVTSTWMGQYTTGPSPLRPGGSATTARSISLPCTPTKLRWDCGGLWDMEVGDEEEEETLATPPRVESGRDLRAKIYGRLASRKMETTGAAAAAAAASAIGFPDGFPEDLGYNNAAEASPDLDWVNQLLVTE